MREMLGSEAYRPTMMSTHTDVAVKPSNVTLDKSATTNTIMDDETGSLRRRPTANGLTASSRSRAGGREPGQEPEPQRERLAVP